MRVAALLAFCVVIVGFITPAGEYIYVSSTNTFSLSRVMRSLYATCIHSSPLGAMIILEGHGTLIVRTAKAVASTL